MIVYLTTNLVNGKKYIGKDAKNNPKYLGSGTAFRKALKKYGKENFFKEILAKADSLDHLIELEIYYIRLYNAVKSNDFYNLTELSIGGRVKGKSTSIPIIQYDKDGNFLKHWSSTIEAAKTLRINRTKITTAITKGETASGFYWSKKDKVLKIKSKDQAYNRKKVEVYKGKILVNVFKSVTECCKTLKIDKGTLYDVMNGRPTKLCYTFKVLGTKSVPKYNLKSYKKIKLKKAIEKSSKRKPIAIVYQYDLNGKFIGKWYGISTIMKSGYSNVCRALKRGLTCGGYYWNYQMLGPENVVKEQHIYFKTMKDRAYKHPTVPVIQLKDGKEVQIFASVKQACKETGIHNITAVLRGKRPIAGGCTWKYLNSNK